MSEEVVRPVPVVIVNQAKQESTNLVRTLLRRMGVLEELLFSGLIMGNMDRGGETGEEHRTELVERTRERVDRRLREIEAEGPAVFGYPTIQLGGRIVTFKDIETLVDLLSAFRSALVNYNKKALLAGHDPQIDQKPATETEVKQWKKENPIATYPFTIISLGKRYVMLGKDMYEAWRESEAVLNKMRAGYYEGVTRKRKTGSASRSGWRVKSEEKGKIPDFLMPDKSKQESKKRGKEAFSDLFAEHEGQAGHVSRFVSPISYEGNSSSDEDDEEAKALWSCKRIKSGARLISDSLYGNRSFEQEGPYSLSLPAQRREAKDREEQQRRALTRATLTANERFYDLKDDDNDDDDSDEEDDYITRPSERDMIDAVVREGRGRYLHPGVRRFPGEGTAVGTIAHVAQSAVESVYGRMPEYTVRRARAAAMKQANEASERFFNASDRRRKKEVEAQFLAGKDPRRIFWRPGNWREILSFFKDRTKNYFKGAGRGAVQGLREDLTVSAIKGAVSGTQTALTRAGKRHPLIAGMRLKVEEPKLRRALRAHQMSRAGNVQVYMNDLLDRRKMMDVSTSRAIQVFISAYPKDPDDVTEEDLRRYKSELEREIRLTRKELVMRSTAKSRRWANRLGGRSLQVLGSAKMPKTLSRMTAGQLREWGDLMKELINSYRPEAQRMVDAYHDAAESGSRGDTQRQVRIRQAMLARFGITPEMFLQGYQIGIMDEDLIPAKYRPLYRKFKEAGRQPQPKAGYRGTIPRAQYKGKFVPDVPRGFPDEAKVLGVSIVYRTERGYSRSVNFKNLNDLLNKWLRRKVRENSLPKEGRVVVRYHGGGEKEFKLSEFVGQAVMVGSIAATRAQAVPAKVSARRKKKRENIAASRAKEKKKTGQVSASGRAKVTGKLTKPRRRRVSASGRASLPGAPQSSPRDIKFEAAPKVGDYHVPREAHNLPSIILVSTSPGGAAKPMRTWREVLSHLKARKGLKPNDVKLEVHWPIKVAYIDPKTGKRTEKQFRTQAERVAYENSPFGRRLSIENEKVNVQNFTGEDVMGGGPSRSIQSFLQYYDEDGHVKNQKMPTSWDGVMIQLRRLAKLGYDLEKMKLIINGQERNPMEFAVELEGIDLMKLNAEKLSILHQIRSTKEGKKTKKKRKDNADGLRPTPALQTQHGPVGWREQSAFWYGN